jgi:hypothetical protein
VGRISGRGAYCFVNKEPAINRTESYMKKKQVHWTPTCAIPSNAAVHAKVPISLQQPISARLDGRVRIFAMPAVPETVPRRTNIGERLREVRDEYANKDDARLDCKLLHKFESWEQSSTYIDITKFATFGLEISSQRSFIVDNVILLALQW